VAEQLGLEQLARYRGGVDGDERFAGARAVAVRRAGDEFLAGRIRDQHRRLRLGNPPIARNTSCMAASCEDIRPLLGGCGAFWRMLVHGPADQLVA
jgi:hypothetical protein